jgi:hypothetical protein
MTDEIITVSPTFLRWDLQKCRRCAWLRLKHGIKQPSALTYPRVITEIHDWIYQYMASAHTADILPSMPVALDPVLHGAGKLIETERNVTSSAINGIAITGRLDGLLRLDTGGYAVIDIKTTLSTPDRLRRNYALQLNAYAHCLEHAAELALEVKPITRLGILAFTPDEFRKGRQRFGLAGVLTWVDVSRDDTIVCQAIRDVVSLINGQMPPARDECAFCRYVRIRAIE